MRKLILVGLVMAVMNLRGGIVLAQMEAQRPREVWKAEWITAADAPDRDEVVLHFRKVIELREKVEHFVVDVSADNQFVFYVNGQRVGTGPSRSDMAHWRYETYDLGPFLRAGKNVLAATVWNFGTHAAVAQMSVRTGFLVHGESEAERVADTDATWDAEVEKGITTFPMEDGDYYFAAGPGERLDAGKFDWSFNREEVANKSAWTKAVTLGHGAQRGESDVPNWQLVKDPLPTMEMKEVSSGRVVRVTGIAMPAGFPERSFEVPAHTKASILVDQGTLITAYPELRVIGGAGSKIRMKYAEALYDAKGEKGNRNEIEGKHIEGVTDEFFVAGREEKSRSLATQTPLGMTSALPPESGPEAQAGPDKGNAGAQPLPSSGQAGMAGAQTNFMPLEWRTWRYLEIDVETADAGLQIQGLKTWFTAYPFEEKGYFRSDDTSLGEIWKIGWRTARLDAHDTYMDTPYWERLQYIGDTRIQAMISYTVAGDDRLARQAIEAFNNSRVPDGLTESRYPTALVQMIPTFSLMWVGMVHDFWRYRGDEEFVKEQLPGTRTVLAWYLRRQRKDGLLGRLPWWPFVDWGKDFELGEPPQEEDGGSSVITLQYVEALRDAAELEETMGDRHVAESYREAARRATEGVWKLCWDADYGLLADTPVKRHFSQHANILGVWLDVIPVEKQKSVMNSLLVASDGGGPWAKYHIQYDQYQALPQMTLATYYFRYYLARAVEHAGMGDLYLTMLRPWQEMVRLGLTTWAESPEPTRSDSHAWSAHPNVDLLRIVAGIQPASAGFATVRIEPHLLYLQGVEAGMPTVRGIIEVRYVLAANRLEAEVKLPEGVTGEFVWGGKTVELHAGEQKIEIGK